MNFLLKLFMNCVYYQSPFFMSRLDFWHCSFSWLFSVSFLWLLHVACVVSVAAPVAPVNPCEPSPCGPYSLCRTVNGHAVCSCQPNYIGAPPSCRPECLVSADCPQDRACINQKCTDPCPGTCGVNARCQVVNHNPICSCPPGFSGDPFAQCARDQSKVPSVYCLSFYPIYFFTVSVFSSIDFQLVGSLFDPQRLKWLKYCCLTFKQKNWNL